MIGRHARPRRGILFQIGQKSYMHRAIRPPRWQWYPGPALWTGQP